VNKTNKEFAKVRIGSSGWLSQPWGHWQWQLATAADSWIFIDSRTQTRAECKHPVDAYMHF